MQDEVLFLNKTNDNQFWKEKRALEHEKNALQENLEAKDQEMHYL